VGKKLGQSRRRIQELGKAEAQNGITLPSLGRVAATLDCELVYAIVPQSGTIMLVTKRGRNKKAAIARPLLHGQIHGNPRKLRGQRSHLQFQERLPRNRYAQRHRTLSFLGR
jgi:hypothetical protein